MDSLNLVTALRSLVGEQMAEVHTSLPARVTGIDYGAKTVTLESIIKNKRGVDDEVSYPTLYDVPLTVVGGGNGRISFPVKSGDLGVVIFSERDPSNALQSDGATSATATLIQPCGLYPICFIPKIAMGNDSTESIDSENVVISNNKQTYASFSPDGIITIRNTQGLQIEITPSQITMTDGSGKLTMSSGNMTFQGGTVNINGAIIDSSGNITDSNGTGLTSHRHVVENVEPGDANITSNSAEG